MRKKALIAVGPSASLEPAPRVLVEGGRFNFGRFGTPFEVVNPLDAKGVFDVPVPRFVKYLRLKEWQAYQLGNSECFMLAVLYHQKAGVLTQFIYYDRKQGRGIKYERVVPPWRVTMPTSLHDSRACYQSRGYRIDFHNQLCRGRLFIDVAMDSWGDLPNVYGHFEALHDAPGARPQVVSLPLGKNRGLYSHKCLMPVRGVLIVGDRHIDFSAGDAFAIVDEHKGYYPYVLRYDWVTGVGRAGRGGMAGFNLTDNQVIDRDRYNENCLWIDGRLHPLPAIRVSRPDGVRGEWRIRDAQGAVDIVFTPEMENRIDMNLLAIRTDYHGPFGSFRGSIALTSGERIPVDGFFGMGERKYLRG